jgi:GT2 family glycosyltransferase
MVNFKQKRIIGEYKMETMYPEADRKMVCQPGKSGIPDLSISIINWNTQDLLANCLESVEQTKDGLDVEIIVVDNASTDGSQEMVQARFPAVKLVENQDNLGFARANNQALEQSRGRYVMLLNSDTLLQQGSLQAMVSFMDSHPEVGIVGARLINGDGSLQRSWARFPSILSEVLGANFRQRKRFSSHNSSLVYEVDWVGGACLLIRHSTMEQVGLLDERFFMYSEELDWCYRTRQSGWSICYLPEACVIHLGGQSSRLASQRMKAELYKSKLLFFCKHYGRQRASLLTMFLQVLFFARGFLGLILTLPGFNRIPKESNLYWDYRKLAGILRKTLREQELCNENRYRRTLFNPSSKRRVQNIHHKSR